MIKRFTGKRFIRWLPLLIVAVLLLLMVISLVAIRVSGWHWRGPGWDGGLRLDAVWQEQAGCRPLEAHGLRLLALRPLTLRVDTLAINDCDQEASAPLTTLPSLPALDVTVWAVQYRDLPPIMVKLSQQSGAWSGHAQFRDSQLHAEYRQRQGRWRLSGTVQGAHLDQRLQGEVQLQGDGLWTPGDWTEKHHFSGELTVLGDDLGLQQQGPQGDLSVRTAWQGDRWRLQANLHEPLSVGAGWVLSPGKGLQARGQGGDLHEAEGQLVANGPPGRAAFSLRSSAARLGEGSGLLSLSEGMRGDIHFQWQEGQLRVAPFEVTGMEDALSLVLREPVSAALAMQGRTTLPLTLSWNQLALRTTESEIAWRPQDLQWRGALSLDGAWQGYQISGGWRGDVGPTGVHGEPAKVRIQSTDLDARLRLPVASVRAPGWPFTATVKGHYQTLPLQGSLTGEHKDGTWQGDFQVSGDGFYGLVPSAGEGGRAIAQGRWRWQPESAPLILSGSQLSVGRTVSGRRLIKPVYLSVKEPLHLRGQGVNGVLSLRAEGLVAERWTLPPVTGTVRFNGASFSADVSVARWGTSLSVDGARREQGFSGRLHGHSPLSPEMSSGLAVTVRAGELNLDGSWRWQDAFQLEGALQGEALALDWGSIEARGLDGQLRLDWRQGQAPNIRSHGPLTLETLDVGVPVSQLRMSAQTDLQQWHFDDIHAAVLGGTVRAPKLRWPSPGWQPVVLTGIELNQLAALQKEAVINLTGEVGGYLPLRLTDDSVALKGGRLANETPLSLALLPASGTQAMARSNQAVSIALNALNPLEVERFSANLDMADDGWLQAAVQIHGRNPQRNALPVVFNYTHRENVLDLLRSLRIDEQITNRVMMESKP